MEKTINNNKTLGITTITIYFVMALVVPMFINVNLTEFGSAIFNLAYQLLTASLIIILLKDQLKESYRDFKKNHLTYFKSNFKYYLIGLLVMFVSNAIIIFLLDKGIAGNEEAVRGMIEANPIFSYIMAVLFAPVIEELVFRQGFRLAIKNDYVFILTSGLVFGFLHILTDFSGLSSLLYLIPYSSLGIAFAYVLVKSKNIFTTIGLHMMHNGLLLSLQIMVLLFS